MCEIKKFDDFEPESLYYECEIRWDDGMPETVIFKTSHDRDDRDSDVFMFCNGLHEIKKLMEYEPMSQGDFVVLSYTTLDRIPPAPEF